MRLLDHLRNTEQKSVNAVRRGMIRAREEWEDVERRLRQRMRIYPQKLKKNGMAAGAYTDLQPDVPTQRTATPAEIEARKPIVSVHGHDVKGEDLENPAA
jgi:hypothetical protein